METTARSAAGTALSASLLIASLLATGTAHAQTLRVPSQYATIGAALEAARSGETVLVAPGTYYESINWPARDGIRLVSEEGARNTIIDAQSQSRVIAFASWLITRATVLEGFTITGGYETGFFNYAYGAGILCEQAGPTIRNNRIIGNELLLQTNSFGAGIYVGRSSPGPRIVGNEIAHNEIFDAINADGVGIYVDGLSRPQILGNRIHNNVAGPTNLGTRGVAICNFGQTEIFSNLIRDNLAATSYDNVGAGIFNSNAAAIYHNTIVNNVLADTPIQQGAGVYTRGHYCTMRGNIIANNVGAGIENDATLPWGGVNTDHDVVWNNAPDYESIAAGLNNRSIDPGFVSPGNYHLALASPCIDAMPSTHLANYAFMNIDMDGEPRVLDSDIGAGSGPARVDLGADEACQTFVSQAGTPQPGTTTDWLVFGPPTATLHALLLSLQHDATLTTPFGNLLLGSPVIPYIGFGQQGTWQQALPPTPSLTGITLLGQGAAVDTNTGSGQLSAVWSATIR
ncbi:MAG: right-handed parallel beta-helix repeat-containing protein [bacterium]|nr:right-handed parallel beta-helix repeat-containing protein [bacterium]